ncbi:hypothetical protein [Actinokineospora sp. HUAS TT18]|uniref:hypothetical protein n=1 Tax=Actinokineospora sp. HUAS TT18 TaxID=3447451 RepID=UPI003F525AA4
MPEMQRSFPIACSIIIAGDFLASAARESTTGPSVAHRQDSGDHMRSTVTRRTTVIIATVATVVVGGGIAYAYWSSTGYGSGSATTGTSSAFVVSSSPPTGAALTPGGPTQTMSFTVTNPSSGSQTLANVAISVANTDGTAWTAVEGCSALDYAVGVPTIAYGPIAPSGMVTGTVTIGMNNLDSNQDACQGITAPLYIVAS